MYMLCKHLGNLHPGTGRHAMPLLPEKHLAGGLAPENTTCFPNVLVVMFAPCPPSPWPVR